MDRDGHFIPLSVAITAPGSGERAAGFRVEAHDLREEKRRGAELPRHTDPLRGSGSDPGLADWNCPPPESRSLSRRSPGRAGQRQGDLERRLAGAR